MKYLFAFLPLLFASFMSRAYQMVKESKNNTLSQNDTAYYSIDGGRTERDHANYYRVIYTQKTDTGYKIEERYIVGNRLKANAFTVYPDSIFFNGPYTSYDNKGHKEYERIYDNGAPVGIWKLYYPETDTLWAETSYINKKNASLISYFKNGKIKRKENNIYDSSAGGICYDVNGKEIPFSPFYRFPRPGVDMNMFLMHNMSYPPDDRDQGIQGRVVIRCTITSYGKATNIHVIRSVSKNCDGEAIRVLSLIPKWLPGTKDDIPVDMSYTLPVTFRVN